MNVIGVLALCTALMVGTAPDGDVADDSRAAVESIASVRALAISGRRAEALDRLDQRLAAKPADSDARVLRGIILSWEGRYDEARRDLRAVLDGHPGHGDAVLALLNVELWSDHPDVAERLASEALERHPNNSALVLARAKALKNLNRGPEARRLLKSLAVAQPTNKDVKQALESTEEPRLWETRFYHNAEWFSDSRTPWREDQIQFSRAMAAGSVIARFSQADRFSLGSRLMEMDWYPHIRTGTYAYMNVGYSPDAVLYPRIRVGLDLNQSLGHGFEGSAGFRQLRFGSDVNIYTGAISKYHGDWLFTARTYITPDQAGASRSFQIAIRRYLGSAFDYWTLRGGWGSSPTEIHSLADIGILDSRSLAVELDHHLTGRFGVHLHGGFGQEDRIERSGLYRYSCDAGVYFRF